MQLRKLTVTFLATFCTLPLILSPAHGKDVKLQKVKSGTLSNEQILVLAKIKNGCYAKDRSFRIIYDCVLRRYDLHANWIKNKRYKLTTIYNNYVDQINNEGKLYQLRSPDGHHRVELYSSIKPGDAFCSANEEVHFSFNQKSHPIQERELALFIRRAFESTIMQTKCTDVKEVQFVFKKNNEVFWNEYYEIEYGYSLGRYQANDHSFKSFAEVVAPELYQALNQ